jgi:hypothetical protein
MLCSLPSGVMTLARFRRLSCLAGAALGLAAAWACSLNPQPLPPGETAEAGSSYGGGGTDAGPAGFVGADASAGGDGGTNVPATDGGTAAPTEGGDSGDAGDGGDGASDGSDGGPSDAATDGEEGGG